MGLVGSLEEESRISWPPGQKRKMRNEMREKSPSGRKESLCWWGRADCMWIAMDLIPFPLLLGNKHIGLAAVWVSIHQSDRLAVPQRPRIMNLKQCCHLYKLHCIPGFNSHFSRVRVSRSALVLDQPARAASVMPGGAWVCSTTTTAWLGAACDGSLLLQCSPDQFLRQ